MKTLEFKTSKGSFMLVDSVETEGIKLSEITEQQASKIVSSSMGNKNFLLFTLKQKRVYLYENPHNTVEAEQQTFYNPVIFKL